MSENEKDVVAGGTFTFDANVDTAMATILRFMNEAKRMRLVMPVDAQVAGGGGIEHAATQIANKLKFAFSTIGKAEDLQAGLRQVQAQLEQIVTTAGTVNMTLGGQTFSLKGKQGVGEFISRLPEYGGAIGAAGSNLKLGIGGSVETTPANLQAAAAIRQFSDATKVATMATIAATNAEKAKASELSLMQRLGQGQPLRRAMAPAISEALGGGELANMMGGITSMLGQAMVFRMGWMLMSLMEQAGGAALKLPGEVAGTELTHELAEWRLKRSDPNSSPEMRDATVTGTTAAIRRVVHDTGITVDSAQISLLKLAEITGSYDTAFDRAVQFASISAAQSLSPKERNSQFVSMMETYGKLKESGDLKGVGAFIDQNPELRKEMRKVWESIRPIPANGENADAAFQDYLGSGRIGPRMLDKLIGNVARSDWSALARVQGSMADKNWTGTEGGGVNWMENAQAQIDYLRRRGISDPKWRSYTTGTIGGPDIAPSGTYGPAVSKYSYFPREGLPGVAGGQSPISVDDERKNVRGHFYQFSAISQLAEQMQTMATGGDIQTEQLTEAQRQTALLEGIKSNQENGGGHSAPLGRLPAVTGAR